MGRRARNGHCCAEGSFTVSPPASPGTMLPAKASGWGGGVLVPSYHHRLQKEEEVGPGPLQAGTLHLAPVPAPLCGELLWQGSQRGYKPGSLDLVWSYLLLQPIKLDFFFRKALISF